MEQALEPGFSGLLQEPLPEPSVPDGGSRNWLIDGTERPRQRPKDSDAQREHYSGKQKTHTDKNVIVVNEPTLSVNYLGATQPGSMHDKKAADSAEVSYPTDASAARIFLIKDNGFQGYEPFSVIGIQTSKKPKGKPLSVEDRQINAVISSIRMTVEHVIAGISHPFEGWKALPDC